MVSLEAVQLSGGQYAHSVELCSLGGLYGSHLCLGQLWLSYGPTTSALRFLMKGLPDRSHPVSHTVLRVPGMGALGTPM